MAANSYLLAPGATGYLSAQFADQAGTINPLSALPTATESTNTLVTALVSTTGSPPAPTDPSFCWSVAAPASAGVGTAFTVDLSGTNLDGTVDPQNVTITIADDDTQVITSFSNLPPAPTPPTPAPAAVRR